MPIPVINTDIVSQSAGRLTDPFKNKPRIKGLIEAFADYCGDLESVALNGFVELMLKNADGTILDDWGANLGLLRDGRDDDEYRSDLRGWWLYLTSKGTPETLILLVRLLAFEYDEPEAGIFIWLMEHPPAHVLINFNGTYGNGEFMTETLDQAAVGGVSVRLNYVPAGAFRFDGTPGDGTGFDVGIFSDLIA